MNLVLDEAEEVSVKFKSRKALGEICAVCNKLNQLTFLASLLTWQ